MLATMNEIDHIQSSIQEPPPASHVPDATNVDDVVPMTSRERGGLGRRRRRSAHGQPPPSQECYIPSPLPQGYMPSPQSYGYMSMPQMQGSNTLSLYDPVMSTPSAPGRWERELVSPNFDFYDMAGTSAPQIDLNTQLFN
ncbi:hypothetical protein RIF29_20322 [Crotalaria pallida]|uniref:Uncharacterized protein n=1 Tax=Crotalaria pallida TaxID=3830 RepID=A0AAN9F105_CROPI